MATRPEPSQDRLEPDCRGRNSISQHNSPRLPESLKFQRDRDGTLETANPRRESKTLITANEQMNMIGHNHVAPKRDVELSNPAMSVLLNGKLGAIQRGNTFAIAGCKSDEVKWLIDVN
jgi:hypothetical protein